MDEIKALFCQRDEAVSTKELSLLEATQLNQLVGSQTGYYTVLERLETELLAVADDDNDLTKVVFTKETSTSRQTGNQHRFVTFGLVHTVAGWKIHTITPVFFRTAPLRAASLSK